MLKLTYTTKFKKDYKRAKKQGRNLKKLENALRLLCTQESLPENLHDHALSGNFKGHRECHIESDWLLIYRIDEGQLVLTATRAGTHSELLGI